jgi:hypothetical protein
MLTENRPRGFVRYYRSMVDSSSVVLARAAATVQ